MYQYVIKLEATGEVIGGGYTDDPSWVTGGPGQILSFEDDDVAELNDIFTEEEKRYREVYNGEWVKQQAALDAAEDLKKSSAYAKLVALGLSPDEAQAVTGWSPGH